MRLYIKTLTGYNYTIRNINGDATISELKRRICEISGIPIESQRLIFAGKIQL